MAYADGTAAHVGDRVDYDGTGGAVEAVIDSPADRATWGLTESGLLLRTEREGLVFHPAGLYGWDALVFLSRAEPGAAADSRRP